MSDRKNGEGSPGKPADAAGAKSPAAEKAGAQRGKVLEMTIEELDLSVRSNHCLKRANINTVADLISKTEGEITGIRNLGRVALEEIKHRLAMMGLALAGDDSDEKDGTDRSDGKNAAAPPRELTDAEFSGILSFLDISVSEYNSLVQRRADIRTESDLYVALREMRNARAENHHSLEEIERKLKAMKLWPEADSKNDTDTEAKEEN